MSDTTYICFPGRLVLVGFGSISRGVLPLILRHIQLDINKITVVTADLLDAEAARLHGVCVRVAHVTSDNYGDLLLGLLGCGDLLLNLGLNVSSIALTVFCRNAGALYIDTAIEPWPNLYRNSKLPLEARTSFAQRDALRRAVDWSGGPTALVAHGANPGLVSHFVKAALMRLASDLLGNNVEPVAQPEWAELAGTLGVKTIHVTELDTQSTDVPRSGDEFVNTWSVTGLIDEASQPAELGWGTHERSLPTDACFSRGGGSIHLTRHGADTFCRSWTPSCGEYEGFLFSHIESLMISDFYSVYSNQTPVRRPTVQFVYRPCDDAVASIEAAAATGWADPRPSRLMGAANVRGEDELGVLLMGHSRGAFWFGSRLSTAEARRLAPANNATTLQVAAGILGAIVWVLENPDAGLREPDHIDHKRVLAVASPYLGDLRGVYTDWVPRGRQTYLNAQDSDPECPWQFRDFRIG